MANGHMPVCRSSILHTYPSYYLYTMNSNLGKTHFVTFRLRRPRLNQAGKSTGLVVNPILIDDITEMPLLQSQLQFSSQLFAQQPCALSFQGEFPTTDTKTIKLTNSKNNNNNNKVIPLPVLL